MPDLYLVIDLIVVIALIGLGFTVLIKNSSVELNRIFALFVTCISVWIIANYISNDIKHAPSTAIIANYFVFFFSYSAALCLLQFGIGLAGDAKARNIFNKIRLPLFLVGLTGLTPLVVAGATLQDKVYAVEFGSMAPLYFISLIGIVFAATHIIRRNIKRTTGDQQGRLKVLFRSMLWTFPVLLLAQAIVPVTTGWFGLTNIGILPMLILVFGLYYGVVKHRLFDLRLIVVRSVVYAGTLGTISVFYGISTHYLTTLISQSSHVLVADTINVALIIVVVVAYAPLRRLFNRLTNRFFYKDAYDPQDLFDHLNRTLVSSLEISYLMQQTTAIMAQYLKAEFCIIALKGEKGSTLRMFGTKNVAFSKHDMAKIRHLTPRTHQSVVLVDYLDQESNTDLQSVLQRNNISAIINLSSNIQKNEEGLGYILLGTRRSGASYTRQDARVLDTIANELIIAIQNALHFEEIEHFNVTLQGKVDEATRKLRHTNDKLRQLDQTKDDFISMASHQLRTPLTSVKGYVSMVLDGDAGKLTPLQRKLLNQSFVSSQRMVYLISDLLNVSRLRTGKFVIEAVPCNLARVIRDEIEQLKETAKGRGLELTYNKPEEFPTYMLDETKIRQVIMNFIDNAIYYTPTGGRIAVSLVEKPTSIEFMVSDNGIGVPKHEQHHLFSKFFRAHNAKRARPDGTGLGLFMAKKVIVAQGGALIFKSQEGKGSTFGFTFAKSGLQSPPAANKTLSA